MSKSHSQLFVQALEMEGFDFFAGVPCSLLSGAISLLDAEPRFGYLSAVREDVAVGVAAGAYLGGAMPVVFMQNSGLGVCFNALASLSLMYELSLLLVVSWRGQDGHDAPEHILTGAVTERLLDSLGVPYHVLDSDRLSEQVAVAAAELARGRGPVALLVPKGILE